MKRILLTFFIAIAASSAHAAAPADSGLGAVDFRYAPPWWQTAICLPDDPDKALVGREGQLLFDFGGGGVRNFGLCLQPELAGESKWIRQETLSPRVPIVQTWKDAGGVEVLEEAFVATPDAAHPPPRVMRVDQLQRVRDWASPKGECARAFRGSEVAHNGKRIQFAAEPPAGGNATVVFGFCEGGKKPAARRPLVLAVEGGETKTVDPAKDFGANCPGLYKLAARDANGDGFIEISVGTPADAPSRTAMLNALWVFDGPLPSDESIIKGGADDLAFAAFPARALPARRVVVLVTLKNPASTAVTRQPQLHIESVEAVHFLKSEGCVSTDDGTRISASAPVESCTPGENNHYLVGVSAVTLPPGATRQVAFTVDRHSLKPAAALTVGQAGKSLAAARQWWEKSGLPYDAIRVPDPGIQAMLESCVRNIWQAREIVKGQPAFHVGPTVYRGLWVVDGSFLLESAAVLGRGQEARAGIEYLLGHQQEDGSFEILKHFWKENGIVLWAATRHALLTQDKAWLRSHWPALQRVVQAIQNLRAATLKEPQALNRGLMPGGFVDGGIDNQIRSKVKDAPEYSNSHWTLAGLKSAIAAARWLDDEASAASWQQEYDGMLAAFRKAAARDTLQDKQGNAYVPIMMGNAGNFSPQKGQWSFCHAVYPGQVFPIGDPFVAGQLAMLRATKVEGMVFDTGWMKDGLWTYFASFYGHALLWEGHGREAAEVLYAFARHACPTRVWREEQKPLNKGGEEVGDMPHNWASAEFIRLTAHLIELDRGDDLHLFEGLPPEWLGPGMATQLNGVLTPFGPLTLELRVAEDGRSAALTVAPLPANGGCGNIVVHLPSGETKRFVPAQGIRWTMPLPGRSPADTMQ